MVTEHENGQFTAATNKASFVLGQGFPYMLLWKLSVSITLSNQEYFHFPLDGITLPSLNKFVSNLEYTQMGRGIARIKSLPQKCSEQGQLQLEPTLVDLE